MNRQSGRHRVTAVTQKQIVALAQRRREIETFNAAARPAPFLALTTDDNGGPVKLAQHARGHDPDHPDVPEQLSLDDDIIGVRVESGPHGADDFLGNSALDLLALAIPCIEGARQRLGGGRVTGQQ